MTKKAAKIISDLELLKDAQEIDIIVKTTIIKLAHKLSKYFSVEKSIRNFWLQEANVIAFNLSRGV